MHNLEIRAAIRSAGFYNYEVAAALGVSESYFSRQLTRVEIPSDKTAHILKTIDRMKERRAENENSNP